MTKCSIVWCDSRNTENNKKLSLHRFPKDSVLRNRWLEAIGKENLKPKLKTWFLCSRHFDETCFNRTLDLVRLRDGAVPSIFQKPQTKQGESAKATMSPRTLNNVSSTSNEPKENVDLPVCPTQNAEIETSGSYNLLQVVHDKIERDLIKQKIKMLSDKCVNQKVKIKRLNEKVRKRDLKIADLNNIIKDLKEKQKVNADQVVLLQECAGPQDFLKRQISKSKGLPLIKKYSEEIRKFALTLHFLSPKAYSYVRRTYNTCLPHPRTLSKWYENVDAEPGFTKEAFYTLKVKVKQNNHPVVCSLIFDEMAIRKSLSWDPKTQKYYGRVDFGHNLDSDSAEEANQALVILLNCINASWKLPIGYFLIKSLTGEQKSILVQTALNLCSKAGVKVVSITCDGPVANFAMYNLLGCDLLRNQDITSFKNGDSDIHIFIDPCHAIKLIRNAFGELRVFIDSLGRRIDYIYLEKLLKLQENQGLHLANKLTKAHIFFGKQKMKVKLATQLLSNSVADALEFCRNELKIKDYEDCCATVNFINIMNNVFDVLNSHSIRPPGWKKAMCPENIGLVRALFESASLYIKNLKLPSGELLINSRRKTGFVGLVVAMNSALRLYEYLVETTQILKYIPLYKVSQDHIELFFSAVRARGGFNNNPNAMQFRAAYKRLLIRSEIKDSGVGNCIPLQQINILTCSSNNPISNLNELTNKKIFVEVPEDHSDLYETYINCITENYTNRYADSVLEYIAGFVTKKLLRCLKCDLCTGLLIGEENVNSLIYVKSRGGLKYSSKSVIDVIKKTEKLIKFHLNTKCKPELYYLYVFKFMSDFFELGSLFYTDVDSEHNAEHRILLIKSVIKVYLDLRLRYFAKQMDQKLSQRSFLTKLILFRNE